MNTIKVPVYDARNLLCAFAVMIVLAFTALSLTGCPPEPDPGPGDPGNQTPVADGKSMANAIPLTENQWADGNLPTEGSVQWFTFTATASTQYIHVNFGTLTLVSHVQVYDSSSGAAVGSETDMFNVITDISSISRTLTVGRTYCIRVRSSDNSYGRGGTYWIGFNTTVYPFGVTPIPLTENQWTDGNLPTSIADDVQWFTFTATASTQYIHVSFGTLERLYVQVYDSSGEAVGILSNLSSSITNISRTLTVEQTYYIRVMRPNNSNGTTYRIGFNTSTTVPIVTYTATRADGVDGVTDTTAINFTFSAAVTGLTANDITVTSGTGAVTKGDLSGSGTSWTLGVTVTSADNVTIAIAKSGIEAGTKNVTVYKAGQTAPTHNHAYEWRFVMPMPNIVSLLEEEACTICDDVRDKRKTYGNLRHWLTHADQTAGGKGSTVTNSIVVPVAIALGDTSGDTGGWGDLLYAVAAAGKYVSLDLTDCTISGTNFLGSTFPTGKSYVVSITFPRTATAIGPISTTTTAVSNGFTNLQSVTGYQNVGWYAFTNCTTLIAASFPNAISIGQNAFQGCTGLTSVSFPKVTTIQSGAFAGCTGLTEVSFPEAITIGHSASVEGAFDGCANLVKAYFLNVTTITTTNNTSGHFKGCSKLAEVYFAKATSIPASTTTALSMFNGCTQLALLYIPLVRDIGDNALNSPNSLTKITIARNCTISAIGQSARVTAFKTFYDNATGVNKAAGTYLYTTAWSGDN